jgi:hypothetical protein
MATVLDFRAPEGRIRTRNLAPRPAKSAEIVIFPGIRIERWPDPRPARPEPHSRRKARAPVTTD